MTKGTKKMNEVNIRVVVKVRPFLPQEKLARGELYIQILTPKQLIVGKDRGFTFDHILPIDTTQEDTYEYCVLPLITSGFQGYNATIIAYGPTGSGKTYTMGIDNLVTRLPDNYGLLPRSLQDIYAMQEKMSDQRDFVVKITYIEIYKEEVHDLLNYNNSKRDLMIRENQHGNTVVSGAVELECTSFDDIMAHLTRGSALRRTGSTQMNMYSSRSHAIFTVMLEQRWVTISGKDVAPTKLTADQRYEYKNCQNYACAKFHFVDLAGSERAIRTGNSGTSLKESTYINSGLLAIGNVISALCDSKRKYVHIPYRDSKITRLLKDSLGGNAKTIMICCVSPCSFNFEETLSAMKYANRARKIKNKPIVNQDSDNLIMQEMKIEIKQLRQQILDQEQTKLSTSVNSATGIVNTEIENKLKSSLKVATNLRLVITEAYHQLTDCKAYLPADLALKVDDWLDFVDELPKEDGQKGERKVHDDAAIMFYENKVEKLNNDLKSDVEIFALKSRELAQVQNNLHDVEHDNKNQQESIQKLEERNQILDQQLVEKQLKIDDLIKNNQERLLHASGDDIAKSNGDTATATGARSTICQDTNGVVTNENNKKRSQSVSAGDNTDCNRPNEGNPIVPLQRAIHSSPAQISVDRVLQRFNARSQIALSRLEESDEVRQPNFSSDDDDDDIAPYKKQPLQDAFKRTDIRRGTYKLSKATIAIRPTLPKKSEDIPTKNEDIEKLIPRVKQNKEKLRKSTVDMQQFSSEIQDLSINIRLKEQLIKGLVSSGKDISELNKQYETKIKTLEQDKSMATDKINILQKAFNEYESNTIQDKVVNNKQINELKKQMELAHANLTSLQKKYKDTVKIASMTGPSQNKIQNMELTVDKLKGSQASLIKQLKEQTESKNKLERDIQRDQQKLCDLQVKHDNQQKVLKIKTTEMSSMQRRLRGNLTTNNLDEEKKLEDQKKWLDNEIEKVLVQRKYYDDLEQDLANREDIVKEKEGMLKERDGLMMKKLRSSQHKENSLRCSLSDDMNRLQLQQEILQNDSTVQDDRRLIEIEEAIDGLNAAIEFRSETIDRKQNIISQSINFEQIDDSMMLRLNSLTATDIRNLLARYFDKVIDLRETIGKKELSFGELEAKSEDLEKTIVGLRESVRQVTIDFERQLGREHNEHELRTQLLISELAERNANANGLKSCDRLEERLLKSEKDLLFYRTTCKELKLKIKDFMKNDNEFGDLNINRKDPSSKDSNAQRSEKAFILHQAPVRLSRREVRRISDEEVSTRRSSLTNDSLDH